jgi:dipeptidyl aminopeptidase/acylaminoacyl peptidase
MRPRDIRHVVIVEELDLSSNGSTAVVVRRSIDGIRYLGHLLAVDLDTGVETPAPRQLTSGIVRDANPQVSPDGRTVAFTRTNPIDDDQPAALYLVPIGGGRARRVRRGRHGGISAIAWSPDCRRIAYTAPVDPPRFLVGPVARAGTTSTVEPRARRITRTDWRWDGEGHLDRWSHLWVIDIDDPTARPRQVTAGDWGVSDISWAPDGRTIVFTADRGPEPDLHPRTTIWSIDVDAGLVASVGGPIFAPREILAPAGWAKSASLSPNGRWVVAVGIDEPEPLDDVSPTLLLAPADGSRAARPVDLAPDMDRPIGNWVDTDLNGWMIVGRTGPVWLDERTVVAVVSDRGRSHVVRFPIDGDGRPNDHEAITGGDITTHTIAVGGGTLAWLGTDGVRAMELSTRSIGTGSAELDQPVRRTTFGSRWQERFAPVSMRLIQAPGPGGPIDVWMCTAADAIDKRLPTIVHVHGGPLGGWAPAPHLEVILWASAGYRVVLPNIRGSQMYGREWITPQLGDWGGVDADDVHAALDHVIDLGLADPERLGIFGLSYGGFMVNWLVGTTDRFRAAVSENGVTNQINDWANSDSGPEYDRASLLGDPFTPEGIERLWRQSPLRHVTNVRTPLLMLQAEDDIRCPAADNEQFFIALRRLRRTVEYVLYPEESHVYGASGRPDRRIDRNERILAWFDRYLRPDR